MLVYHALASVTHRSSFRFVFSPFAQAAGAELKVVTAFSTYRELKDDLEKVHVYSSDNPTGSL